MQTRGITFFQGLMLLLLLVAVPLAISGGFNERKSQLVRYLGVSTEGKVTGAGQLEQKRGKKTHYVTVEYLNAESLLVTKTFKVKPDEYSAALAMGQVPVTVVEGHPNMVALGTKFSYNRTLFYIAMATILLSIMGLAYRPFRSASTEE